MVSPNNLAYRDSLYFLALMFGKYFSSISCERS
jgi:hypothetical protein